MEIWKDIEGYEGLYQASSYGRIKSIKNNQTILKFSIGEPGYYKVGLCKNGKNKTFKVHRIIAGTFIKKESLQYVVNHKDGNKTNNHIDNLEWITQKENIKHAYKNGLMGDKKSVYLNGYTRKGISIRCDKQLSDKLDIICKQNNVTRSRMIEYLIEVYINHSLMYIRYK